MQADLYLDLLKNCVSNTIYNDDLDVMRGTFQQDPNTGKFASLDAAPADPEQKF